MSNLALVGAPTAPGPPPNHQRSTVAFVDARYLHRSASRALARPAHQTRIDVLQVRDMLIAAHQEGAHGACERIYWYEAAFDPNDPRAAAQRRYLTWLGDLDLVQLRTGYLGEIEPDWQPELRAALKACQVEISRVEQHFPLRGELRQKGVDVLLACDLLGLALRGSLTHALLVLGDSDFTPVVQIARDLGLRITILTPQRHAIPSRLRSLADSTREIPKTSLATLLADRPTHLKAVPERASERSGKPTDPSSAPVLQPRRLSHSMPELTPSTKRPCPARRETTSTQPPVRLTPFLDTDADRVGMRIHTPRGTRTVYLQPSLDEPEHGTLELHLSDQAPAHQDTPLQLIRPFEPTADAPASHA